MRKYYVKHSYMGLNWALDAPCWKIYIFPNKRERDNWLKVNSWDGRQWVATTATRAEALKINKEVTNNEHY